MANSPLVSYTKISPNKTSPRKHAIDTITIHCVEGQCSVETLGSIFASSSKKASSNYGIGPDGRIGMYVEERDRSWCSSNSANDNRAITIEVASDTSHPYAVKDAAYNALIDLLVDICKRNNIKKLLWKGDKSLIGCIDKQNMTVHRWFANKSCPGDYLYNKHAEIAETVNKRLGVFNESENASSGVSDGTNFTEETNWTVTPTFKVGDLVSIASDAKYYNGTDIPVWVKKQNWRISSISGDRVVIDKNENGDSSINSPINSKYLSIAKKKSNAPFLVEIDIPHLNIRKGPGVDYDITGNYTGRGVFTITEVSSGNGSTAGWGRLKSGAGWISLDYVTML